jgi:protein-S-isoprenylcysteine O-methyltransferase Ste14
VTALLLLALAVALSAAAFAVLAERENRRLLERRGDDDAPGGIVTRRGR